MQPHETSTSRSRMELLELVGVAFDSSAILGAAVGEHAQQRDAMFGKERQHIVIEIVGSGDGRLPMPRRPT